MAGVYDGSIRINTKIDSAGAKTDLASLSKSLKSFAASVGVAFGVGAVVSFTKSCIDLASDLNEVKNVVDTTFGASAQRIYDFADTADTAFGLSTLAAEQYTGTMGAMLKSMGFGTDAAADMSIAMAGLAGDMASFYNLDSDVAFEKIRSGISGETEPLKQLGVNLSEANLSAYALAEGMGTAYSKMSEQEKALTRYNYLMSVTADAQGDFAKTSNSWANQVRVLKLQWDSLKATLGGAFIQLLTPVLRIINALISRLNAAATVFANFVAAITGHSQTATTAATEAADAVDGLTNSTEAAGTAAKKTGKGLASFDQLNTLADSSTGGTSSGISTDTGEIESTSTALKDVSDSLEKFKTSFDFTALRQSLADLLESLKPFSGTIGEGLRLFYNDVLKPMSEFSIEYVIPEFLNRLGDAFWSLGEWTKPFMRVWKWLSENVLQEIREWGKTGAGENFKKFFADGLVRAFLIASGSLGQFIFLFSSLKPLIQTIKDKWAEWSPMIKDWFENDVKPWFAAEKWNALGASISGGFSNALDSIKAAWSTLATWFNTIVVAPISGFFGGLFAGIKTGASVLASYIKDYVITPIVTLFRGLYNSLIGIMEGVVNGFIKIINTFISGINSVIKTINKIVPGKLSKIGSLSTVSIPRLAQGAVIAPNREFVAVLGDQRRGVNIETPLATMIEAFDASFDKAFSRLGISGAQTANITLELDGAALVRKTFDLYKNESTRRGASLVTG